MGPDTAAGRRAAQGANILLNAEGAIKLADFGVSTRLASTLARCNTFVGSPYWMAPVRALPIWGVPCVVAAPQTARPGADPRSPQEVVSQDKYNDRADIWSLGIVAIELAEGQPPRFDMHPMRVLLSVVEQEPPDFKDPSAWSDSFRAFVHACLVKDPEARPSATELLQVREGGLPRFFRGCASLDARTTPPGRVARSTSSCKT